MALAAGVPRSVFDVFMTLSKIEPELPPLLSIPTLLVFDVFMTLPLTVALLPDTCIPCEVAPVVLMLLLSMKLSLPLAVMPLTVEALAEMRLLVMLALVLTLITAVPLAVRLFSLTTTRSDVGLVPSVKIAD